MTGPTHPFSEGLDDPPDDFDFLEQAGRKLWARRARWIRSVDALRADPILTATANHLRELEPAPSDVIGWIRRLYKHAAIGPDCAAIAITLESGVLPPIVANPSLRSVLLPLLGLKGARFNVEDYRVGELKPADDDGPTAPVTLDDVTVPAVALCVIEALNDIEPPALSDIVRWLNGYWTLEEQLCSRLSALVEKLITSGDALQWRPGRGITPAWALEAIAERSPSARRQLEELARRVRRAEHERRPNSDDGRAGGVAKHLRPLPPDAEPPKLTRTQCDARHKILSALLAEPPRSVLLVGARGSGRSVVAAAAARTVSATGSPVYVGSPTDISAGAVYTNELDGRITETVDALGRADAVWIASEFDRASTLGRHSESSSNFADRITQAVATNRIRLLAELTEPGYAGLLRESPAFANACAVVRLEDPPPGELRLIAQATLEREAPRLGSPAPVLDDAILDIAFDLSEAFLSHLAQPAAIVRLTERVAAECATASRSRVGVDHLYAAVTALTGVPRSLIDSNSPLDVGAVRDRLTASVMGQPRAIEALVERLMMIKAGLCSRERPYGVFLFLGGTGTGKTELARALARELFGDVDRLIRVDMSELDWYSGTLRLLGDERNRGSSLADQVRAQPCSVVLFDEFEKADPRLWDLFLPLFDAGSLTDALGRKVDFRQTIVIATSNLGASLAARGPLGFTSSESSDFEARSLMDVVRKTFRPELLNRFDEIVTFRPLDRVTMREIVRREIRALFQRRGLRGHDFSIDDDAIDVVVERGFTKDLGARPALRAVEQLIAVPLAKTLAGGGTPPRPQSVIITASGNGVDVALLPMDAGAKPHLGDRPRRRSGTTQREASSRGAADDESTQASQLALDLALPASGDRRRTSR